MRNWTVLVLDLKLRQENLLKSSSGDEYFENVCTKDHKIVKLRLHKTSLVHASKDEVFKTSLQAKKWHPVWYFNNSWGKSSQSKPLPLVYQVHQEGNIFSICCSTGEFSLDFLKVIITANSFATSFTNCWNSWNSVYDVMLAECRVGAYWSCRKKKNLYSTHTLFRHFVFPECRGCIVQTNLI